MGRKLPKYLTRAQVRSLLESILPGERRERLAIVLMLRAGLRISEVCHLRVEDLDFEGVAKLNVRGGKGDKDRAVPLDEVTVSELLSYVNGRKSGFIILPRIGAGHGDRPLDSSNLRKTLRLIFNRAGIPKEFHPHSLRHTFAVESVKADRPLPAIRDMLGHSDLSVTQIYTELAAKDLEKIITDRPLSFEDD